MSGLEQKSITVAFRCDDYSRISNTDLEVKLIKAFQGYNIPCTFGVIPYVSDNCEVPDPDPQKVYRLPLCKASILNDAIKAGILEVALHGYSHRTIRIKAEDADYTEFSGLDYNSQIKKIAKGRSLLEKMLGVRITTFIPPWNAYDTNTIRVLEELGFRIISADNTGVITESSQLKFLPFTCDVLNLKGAVESARKISDVQPVIVVFFHAYDFLEIGMEKVELTYQDFVQLLTWVRSQKDVHVRTIDEATQVIRDLDSHRFISNFQFYSLLEKYSPSFLKRLNSDKIYFYISTISGMKVKLWFFLTLFYFIELAISITKACLKAPICSGG